MMRFNTKENEDAEVAVTMTGSQQRDQQDRSIKRQKKREVEIEDCIKEKVCY